MSVQTDHQSAVEETEDERAQAGVAELAVRARTAARSLRSATTATKDAALHGIADALVAAAAEITAANAIDVQRESDGGMSPGLVDRLRLDETRIAGIADAVRELAALPDPVGEVVRGQPLPNGLTVRQTRVPMGVVGMIYEARPNVTVDAAGLALKSGNAVLLRGGSAAEESNAVIVRVLRSALTSAGLPADAIATVDAYGRAGARALMRARGLAGPPRGYRADPDRGGRVGGAGDRDRCGQLSPVRRCRCGPDRGAADPDQCQDPARRGVQHDRDPAGAPAGGRGVPARRARSAVCRGRAHPRGRGHGRARSRRRSVLPGH